MALCGGLPLCLSPQGAELQATGANGYRGGERHDHFVQQEFAMGQSRFMRSEARRYRISPAHHGFTLVELLVVISIISLLVAVLLPALSQARRYTKITTCQSNMRQHGILFGMYLNDAKDFLPSSGSPHHWQAWATNSFVAGVTTAPAGVTRDTTMSYAWTAGLSFVNKWASCPSFGGNAVFPTGFGWFYWMGYLDPIAATPAGRVPNLPLITCPDAPVRIIPTGGGAGQWPNESVRIEVQYSGFSNITSRLSQRNPTANYSDPTGSGTGAAGSLGDCFDQGITISYAYRGTMYDSSQWSNSTRAIRPNASNWRPGSALVVDVEAWRAGDDDGIETAHNEGLNILRIDGSARFGGNNISGRTPYRFYSADTASAPTSLRPRSWNNAYTTEYLWRYYETGQVRTFP